MGLTRPCPINVADKKHHLHGMQWSLHYCPPGSTLSVDEHSITLLLGLDGMDGRRDGYEAVAEELTRRFEEEMERT